MVRLSDALMETARHISRMTGKPIGTVIEDACRDYFKWWLAGASASLNELGKREEERHAVSSRS